ncbi:helix-turn-helix domain-containing protein [Nocardia colli]|nr:helix-turn-helix domain-containing protein [Nocardia colli]
MSAQLLADEIRRRHAEELLIAEHLSIEQIAHRLGYNATPAFTASITRWTGMPPRAYHRSKLRPADTRPATGGTKTLATSNIRQVTTDRSVKTMRSRVPQHNPPNVYAGYYSTPLIPPAHRCFSQHARARGGASTTSVPE